MKKYLKLTITANDGRVFSNPLRLGEVVLISQIIKENKSVLVELAEMTTEHYKLTFA